MQATATEAPIVFRDCNAILRFDDKAGVVSILSGADRTGKNSVVLQCHINDVINMESGEERLARQQRRSQEHADHVSLQASENAAINAGANVDDDVGCFSRGKGPKGSAKRRPSLMAGGADSETEDAPSAGDHQVGPQPFFLHYVAPKKTKLITATFFSRSGRDQLALVRGVINLIVRAVYLHGPKELVVFVSPVSGSGGAKKMWEREVLPLLSLSKHSIHVVTTTRQAHAEDYIADISNDLNGNHVCVAVGGDGMMHEAVNGLQRRRHALAEGDIDEENTGLPLLAAIPAGSGCALAKCFNILEPIEAAKALVHLNSTLIDLFHITYVPCQHNYVPLPHEIKEAKKNNLPVPQSRSEVTSCQDPPRYAFLNVAFAITNEVDKGSEHMRWMGNARFTVKAMQILATGIPLYRCKVRYRAWSHAVTGETLEKTETHQMLPHKTYPKCTRRDECAHCLSSRKRSRSGNAVDREQQQEPGMGTPTTPMTDEWKELPQDRFVLLMLNNLMDAARDMAMAPLAHVGDGCIDLVYNGRVPGDNRPVARAEFIKIFLGLEGGSHITEPQVHYVKAQEVEVMPEDGLVMADGELLPASGVRVKTIPQAVRVVRSM